MPILLATTPPPRCFFFFFFKDRAPPGISPLSLHGALPIWSLSGEGLLLAPPVMAWPGVRKMTEPYQPMLEPCSTTTLARRMEVTPGGLAWRSSMARASEIGRAHV